MNRQPLLDALAALPDEQFEYIVHLCHDLGWRDTTQFGVLSASAREAVPSLVDPPQPLTHAPVVVEPVADTPAQPEGDLV